MFNYDNIGGKIKGLAKAAFIVETIAAVIAGIVLMTTGGPDDDMILYGWLVLIAAPIIAWIFSWFLYGFGQLIENSDIIAKNSHIIKNTTKATADFSQDTARNSYIIAEELKGANEKQE